MGEGLAHRAMPVVPVPNTGSGSPPHLWAEVREETGKWGSRWKIRDRLADGRCSQAVLNFLSLQMWEG